MTTLSVLTIVTVFAGSTLAGVLAQRLGQPAVVGWLTAGVTLGVVGGVTGVLPDSYPSVPQNTYGAVATLAHLGLVLAVCEAGHHVRTTKNTAAGSRPGRLVPRRASTVIAVLGPPAIALPLVWLVCRQLVPPQNLAHVVAFVTVALSVTAVPVLVPIVGGLAEPFRRIGTKALRVAVVSDAVAWAGLAVIVATATSRSLPAWHVAAGAALTASATVLARGWLRKSSTPETTMPVLVAGTLAAAAGTDMAGLHASLGAVVFGCCLPRRAAVSDVFLKLRPLTYGALLPLLIAAAAAQVPVRTVSFATVLVIVEMSLVATVAKVLPALLAARRDGELWPESVAFATLLTTRGATEIVVITIGASVLELPPPITAALFVVAVTSTIVVVPLLGVVRKLAGHSAFLTSGPEPFRLPTLSLAGPARTVALRTAPGTRRVGVSLDSSGQVDHHGRGSRLPDPPHGSGGSGI